MLAAANHLQDTKDKRREEGKRVLGGMPSARRRHHFAAGQAHLVNLLADGLRLRHALGHPREHLVVVHRHRLAAQKLERVHLRSPSSLSFRG
jgi:hypothetical protein